MSEIIVAGAGAFGTALAIALHAGGKSVRLMGRDIATMREQRENPKLPGVKLPETLELTEEVTLTKADLLLLALPMQQMGAFLEAHHPAPRAAIACCKGVDLTTLKGPTGVIADHLESPSAILTGPSFAADLARGLPTAITLACANPELGAHLQAELSTERLRLYLSTDPTGAELGGALKNVIAIGCGICMGAGLGESARAALMTRGFAEMQRMALALGAQPDTLSGLSGFGDLALTCTSEMSRNFSFGLALGTGTAPREATTEGRATSQAVVKLAKAHGIEMPISQTVAGIVGGTVTLNEGLDALLSRPLGKE